MTPDLHDQWIHDRVAARQHQAAQRRLAWAGRAPSPPWQAKAGLWLIGLGMALVARAPQARFECGPAARPAPQR